MKCRRDTCTAPATLIARIKNGPGDFDLIPELCACESHRDDIHANLPTGKCVQVIPVPSVLVDVDNDTVAKVVKAVKGKNRSPDDVGSEVGLHRRAAAAVMRTAGQQV